MAKLRWGYFNEMCRCGSSGVSVGRIITGSIDSTGWANRDRANLSVKIFSKNGGTAGSYSINTGVAADTINVTVSVGGAISVSAPGWARIDNASNPYFIHLARLVTTPAPFAGDWGGLDGAFVNLFSAISGGVRPCLDAGCPPQKCASGDGNTVTRPGIISSLSYNGPSVFFEYEEGYFTINSSFNPNYRYGTFGACGLSEPSSEFVRTDVPLNYSVFLPGVTPVNEEGDLETETFIPTFTNLPPGTTISTILNGNTIVIGTAPPNGIWQPEIPFLWPGPITVIFDPPDWFDGDLPPIEFPPGDDTTGGPIIGPVITIPPYDPEFEPGLPDPLPEPTPDEEFDPSTAGYFRDPNDPRCIAVACQLPYIYQHNITGGVELLDEEGVLLTDEQGNPLLS